MENLYKIRQKKRMSQTNLGMKIGISQETISSYESGKSYPAVDTLLKLCDVFNVSADFLLDRTDISLTINDFCDKNLSPEELELVANFRKLSYSKKNRALGLIMGMAEE